MVFLCVWKQWYIYDMWNVKGFIINVALCHHWIYCIPRNTMELTNMVKKSRQTLMNLSWVKYGKKTNMELYLKGFPVLYHVFFVIFSWSDLESGMGGVRDQAVSWSLVFPPKVNQFGIVLNFDLDWWNSLLESIVEWIFGVPFFGCHSECFTIKIKTIFPSTSLIFDQFQNRAKIAYGLRYSNIYNRV